ncbi:putative mitochondrial DnaJ chaperone, partial [Jimgerdemannia flammicorona]
IFHFCGNQHHCYSLSTPNGLKTNPRCTSRTPPHSSSPLLHTHRRNAPPTASAPPSLENFCPRPWNYPQPLPPKAPSRAAKQDPYVILGVSKTASQNDIKKAYYALAKKYHPDTNKDADAREKFVQIQEAYEILSDDQKRAHYDQFGHQSEAPSGPSGAGFGGFDPNDLFSSFFGAGFGARTAAAGTGASASIGDDIQKPITLTFMEAAKGTTKNITIEPIVSCASCSGTGLKAGKQKETCRTCRGTGVQSMVMGGFHMQTTCQECGGIGTHIPSNAQCQSCDGGGRKTGRKTVQVNIPPGVDNNSRIRMAGEGDAPMRGRGPSGDLYVLLNVLPSETFRRQDSDVFVDTTIPFHLAVLGGEVRVPTIDGDVELKVPSGSQPGDNILLRKRGIKKLRNQGRGDQIVTLKVELPKTLTEGQRSIIQEYAKLVDPAYHSISSSSSSPSTSNPRPTSNDDALHRDEKGGFLKSTFGKWKERLDPTHHKDTAAGGKAGDREAEEDGKEKKQGGVS